MLFNNARVSKLHEACSEELKEFLCMSSQLTNLMHKFLFCNKFITLIFLYMLRALLCSSSGGQIVLIKFDLLMMSATVLEICRRI
jgi:hypothetical protein